MGNLRRKFGLAIDNLISAEIVTASGEVKTASANENADLFWAVREAAVTSVS
jgi:FAD/FMN-containing dehydrogenase